MVRRHCWLLGLGVALASEMWGLPIGTTQTNLTLEARVTLAASYTAMTYCIGGNHLDSDAPQFPNWRGQSHRV
jgi:hypothetical protein